MLLLIQAVSLTCIQVVVSTKNSTYQPAFNSSGEFEFVKGNNSTNSTTTKPTKSALDDYWFDYNAKLAELMSKFAPVTKTTNPYQIYTTPTYSYTYQPSKTSSSSSSSSGNAKYSAVIVVPGSGFCYIFYRKKRYQPTRVDLITVETVATPAATIPQPQLPPPTPPPPPYVPDTEPPPPPYIDDDIKDEKFECRY